ncbi:plasmid replication, integration and excision activator [Arsenicicoccus bolidensis]|uniref:Plasmid replication, integration and excision activator n=1 Tax=Arsenicicoccus bolidensis TaxID=229480 RepID=A0ABS9Q176_9MICO|nr:plasmid replication, integration and excision activator [Arsenicicoccus bolidensis]MCG7321625.1 plasmid replication, integration and excision activator [Arsenicicoccus bolidensis]
MLDFNAPSRADGSKPQQLDKDSGLPLWAVQVLDSDPEPSKASKTVTVKIAPAHQPVPPANEAPFPFTPVEFTDLTALPWVDISGSRPRIAWSFKASGARRSRQGRQRVEGGLNYDRDSRTA